MARQCEVRRQDERGHAVQMYYMWGASDQKRIPKPSELTGSGDVEVDQSAAAVVVVVVIVVVLGGSAVGADFEPPWAWLGVQHGPRGVQR